MLRIVFRQGLVYLGSNLFSRAVNFILLPLYARVLTPGEFGVYELLIVFAGFANLLVVLEVAQGVARFYVDAADPAEKKAYASTALWFTVGAFTVFVGFGMAFAEPISAWLLASAGETRAFCVALLAIWSNGICYLLQNQLRWQLQAVHFAISNVCVTLVSQAVAVFLVLAFNKGAEGLLIGVFLGGAVGAVVAFRFTRKSYGSGLNWTKLWQMLRFSAPLAASGLAMVAMINVDRIAIKEFMSVHDVGLYAVAARFAGLASVLLFGFQATLTPLITNFHRDANTPIHLARIFRYFLACALPLILGLAVFSREIIVLFVGTAYESAHSVVPVLAASSVLAGMYVFTPGLWLTRKSTSMLAINIATAMLNILLTFELVPAYGLKGAAIAALSGALANFLLQLTASQKDYPTPIEWRTILPAIAVCLALSLWANQGWFPAGADIAFRFALLFTGGVSLVMILMRVAELKQIYHGLVRELRIR